MWIVTATGPTVAPFACIAVLLARRGGSPVTILPPVPLDKDEARRAARARRAEIGEAEAIAAAASLAARFAETIVLGRFDVLAGYWPIRGEIDVRPLLLAHRKKGGLVALPAVETIDAPLAFRLWDGAPLTQKDTLGLAAASGETVTPRVLLVPLLAFDRAGHRLGYGAGYYDRTITALRNQGRVLAIGVGFSAQQVEAVLAEPHDAKLDWIVTERFAFQPQAA